MKLVKLLAFFLLISSCGNKDPDQKIPWGSKAPIYTTHAAAMERSEFLIDQGYEFFYDDPENPLLFHSQKGGTLGLVFRIDGELIQNVKDYFHAPQIHESYPDMVSFSCFPKEGIEVKGIFLVYSSKIAIQELEFINHTQNAVAVEMIPFVSNPYRTFREVDKHGDKAIQFLHEKYPDSWSLNQGIPYEDSLQNTWFFSEKIGHWGSFSSFDGEMARPSFGFDLNRKSSHQIFGRAYDKGERLLENGADARIMVSSPNDPRFILTENSPIWGSPVPSIDFAGLFRLELGNFPKQVSLKSLSLIYYNLNRSIGDQLRMESPLPNQRIDFNAKKEKNFQFVKGIKSKTTSDGIQISWQALPGSKSYKIYKRTYPENGFYELLTEVQSESFEDKFDSFEGYYGYIILPVGDFIGVHSEEVFTFPKADFNSWLNNHDMSISSDHARVIATILPFDLSSKNSKKVRIGRRIDSIDHKSINLLNEVQNLLTLDFEPYWNYNKELFANVPSLSSRNEEVLLLYKSAWNMMRQVMYPPEGRSPYNYYVFSREPTWGWGHGGQVFHESITMLAYAFLDPESAMNSQRVFSDRQYDNGYINYRTGSYLDEIIEYNGQLTSSAPWYSWLNWEIFKITQDREFLKEMYASSKKFYNFYISERDADGDGLLEWGGHAILESVRDALVAVWDEVGWPSNFESIDLNCMMVMEAKALENMALTLGLQEEAAYWRKDHEKRAALINQVFWDEKNGFYYNVNKADNSFTFKTENDLKRDEIIGFLPLWAGVADDAKARRLVQKLTDKDQFWRKFGIPSLSAADPFYNDKGYWNGPVWVEWNYLIFKGLKDYGYHQEAAELTDNIAAVMISQLKQNHNLWEFYSPDEDWAGYHKTYIWAGIINRMLMDKDKR
ncbi:amylo-alpha-1,6-glucosidase [Cecembia calidifontis]|uniref:Glycosyl hydrolase family 63 n=1 Tax=Cecembia calidifontis TaxID=1187080 RepID=A0A4V2F6V1_9BACT|nr:trehalase family glycosidase [Cecembia calidifontis]RZS97599.1 glycosyl hydrolase family 63 [Cecembia calidifontis]